MTGTDMIILRQAEGDVTNQVVLPWLSTWPPPPRLIVVENADGEGGHACYDPAAQTPEGMTQLRSFRGRKHEFVLLSASEQPEPALANEDWFRGAQYVVESALVDEEREE